MADVVSGSPVYGRDFPPSQYDQDWSLILNVTTTSYIAGTPEVGANLTAPTSGRALVCIGCGLRNNSAANVDRILMTFVVYEDNSNGPLFLSASAYNGVTMVGSLVASEFHYAGGHHLVEGMTPGRNYYFKMVYRSFLGSGTADIASRDIAVIPMP